MNTKNIGALILCLFMALSPGKEASAFNSGNYSNVQSTNYIVVIGAFAVKRNAERFTKRAIQQKYQAKFQFNPDRNLYYVFTLTTSEKENAMSEAKRLREETAYTDAWVYQGAIGETTDDGLFTLKVVECLGACGYAPMMQFGKTYREHLTKEKVDKIIEECVAKAATNN